MVPEPRLRPLSSGRHSWRATLSVALGLAAAVIAAACGATSTTSVGPTPQRCELSLNATPNPAPAAGGAITVAVTAAPECAWTATENVSWITAMTPASGQGDGQITLTAAANATLTARQDNVAVNGINQLIRQDAGTCAPQLSALSTTVTSEARAVTVTVTVITGCPWTAVSNAGFISVASGASGNANGTVTLNIAANPVAASRQGTVTIAGQTFTVTQGGANCVYSISPAAQSFASGGGPGSATVTSPEGCAWSATSSAGFVTITGGSSGSGTGPVAFNVAANETLSPRSGTLTIAGQTFTVNQAALTCSYSISPDSADVSAAGGTSSTRLETPAVCDWSISTSDPAWLNFSGPANRRGPSDVSFTVAANPIGTARQATLTIAGQTFRVTQDAAQCQYSIAPTARSGVPAAGATGTVTVTATQGCGWNTENNSGGFITLTGGNGSGSGNGTVSYSVAANTSANGRQGTLIIAGQTFTLSQEGVACSFSISPASQNVGASGGTGSVTVAAPVGCGWNAASNNPAFISITGATSGSGNGTVAFAVADNLASSQARTGTLTIAGQTFTVNQAGATCTFSITPNSATIPAAGGNGSINIAGPAGCTWTTVNSLSYVTIAASGTVPATVPFTVAANSTGQARNASFTIGGQAFTVNQAGQPCTYSFNPATPISVPATGASGSVGVTTIAGCDWTVTPSTNPAFITVGGGGSGPGNVSYTVAANTAATARAGTLTLTGGQSLTINQAAGCSFTISPTGGRSHPNSALAQTASVTVTVVSGVNCAWTAVSANPLAVAISSGASGTGSGTVQYLVLPQLTGTRSTVLTIAGQTFVVTQGS